MIYNLSLEERLLAGLIKYPNVYHEICDFINEDDFSSDEDKITKTIFNVVKNFCEQGKKVDYTIIAERIKDLGISFAQDINISDYIYSLLLRTINENQVLEIAKELKKITARRSIYNTCREVAKKVKDMPSSVSFEEIVDQSDRTFNKQLNLYDTHDEGFYNIYEEMEDYIEYLGENPDENRGFDGPFERVNQLYGSLIKPGNITVIVARSGVGKMQPLRCKVLTPQGFIPMRFLKAGDTVITPSGKTSKIVQTFDHKNKLIFRIILNDGRSTLCGAEHLWKVKLKKDDYEEWVICDTNELLLKRAKGYSIFLPKISDITIRDSDVFGTDTLSDLCIENKTIPEFVINSLSFEKRLEFCKKVISKFGYIKRSSKKLGKKYYLHFETDFSVFYKDFREVILSLGYLAHSVKKGKKYTLLISGSGIEKITPDDLLKLSGRTSNDLCNDDELFISQITVMDKKEDCRCIEIDDNDHLYITDDFIVTHNTRLALDYCTKIADMHNIPVLHFDNGEMSKEELMIRQCANLSGVSAAIIEKGWRNYGKDVVDKIRSVWPRVKHLKFIYHGVGGYSLEQMISVLKRYYYSKVGRGNNMLFSFDYIKPRESKTMTEWQYIGYMLDTFKTTIQKELLHDGKPIIPMFTSVQANRSGVVGNRQAQNLTDDESIVAMSDRIVQYCSHLFLLREKTLDELEFEQGNFGTHKLINLKSRHLGELWERAINKIPMPDNSLVKNCIHLNMRGFNIECLGDHVDLLDAIEGNILQVPNVNENEADPQLN